MAKKKEEKEEEESTMSFPSDSVSSLFQTEIIHGLLFVSSNPTITSNLLNWSKVSCVMRKENLWEQVLIPGDRHAKTTRILLYTTREDTN